MLLQHKLSKLFFSLLILLVSANSFAETKWEVATIFLGTNESVEFQADIENNLQEISKITPGPYLKIQTYHETKSDDSKRSKILNFLKSAFKDPRSHKALVIYGHGVGPLGLKELPTIELKTLLKKMNIKLDLIWFDSCFLANLEFLYEMKEFSSITIASEEAEFSAGLPFEALNELPNFETAKAASVFLAKRFVESYSFIKNGDQREYVSVSSATISVVNNQELDNFLIGFKNVKKILDSLSLNDKEQLKKLLTRKYSMDDKSLIDLGHLVIELRKLIKNSEFDSELTKIIRLLNIESVKKLKSNPRIRINAVADDSLMMFGFNNWQNGIKEDYLENPLFMSILPAKNFKVGPNKKEWPVKKIEGKSILITPFAPGINSFEYLFLNASGTTAITKTQTIIRTHDVVENPSEKESAGAFLIYSAYTQQIGTKAEKYTGINISLFDSVPSIDYFEMSFNQKIQWLVL
jgi:hypothetical protein